MKSIAIIPARSGSQRIQNKNILSFHNKPMLYWPIKALQQSKLFDEIFVSTDSKKIAKIAENLGAKVPYLRPKKISNNSASTIDVIKHLINFLSKKNLNPNYICCVYPTSVFLHYKLLLEGFEKLKNNNYDFIFTANRIDNRLLRSFSIKNNNSLRFIFTKNNLKRTQDLDLLYIDAAQFYWGQTIKWNTKNKIISTNSSFIEINPDFTHDIDVPDDLIQAYIKFKKFRNLIKKS